MSIVTEINSSIIDWNRVEEEIKALGDKINEYDDDNCYLSDLLSGFDGDGSILVKTTELFLQNGFDVAANGGHNGASCLHELCWSCDDYHILEIAELLLDAGANTKIPAYDDGTEDGVLDSIDWRLADWLEGDYDSANLFRAYYDMVYSYEEGRPYKGIRAAEESIGHIVEKVEKLTFTNENIPADVKNDDFFSGAIVIWLDGMPLIVSSFPAATINPYRVSKALNRMDISTKMSNILGARIEEIKFYSVQNMELKFDNGYKLRVSRDSLLGYEQSNSAHFILDNIVEKWSITSGMVVDEIILRSGFHWDKKVNKYHEDMVILSVAGSLYRVSGDGRKTALLVDTIPKSWIGPVKRKIVSGKLIVDNVILNEDNQIVQISLIDIDGGEHIYVAVDKNYGQVFFAKTTRNDKNEEIYVSMEFEDDSEWAKQEFPTNKS